MKHPRLLPASSLGLLLALIFGSAQAQVTESDSTFDIEAANPAVEAELTETEEELRDFFEDEPDFRPQVRYTPDADARTEKMLLERAEQEMGEFNDIEEDDLAELTYARRGTGQPRLEKPGQVEKDAPILDCPAGTVAGVDSCVAGPDFVFD